MAVTPVKGFQTSDGQFWTEDQKQRAERHQRDLDFRSWCQENICGGGHWTASMVADAVLDNWYIEGLRPL